MLLSLIRIVAISAFVLTLGGSVSRNHAQTLDSQVLFVCEHGNVKSLMAASYFNQLAQERGLRYRAVSRGTAPNSTAVPNAIIQGLAGDGFDVSSFHPSAVKASDASASQRVITIGTELPADAQKAAQAKMEQWSDVPAASDDYSAARAAIKRHVDSLVASLEATNVLTKTTVIEVSGPKGQRFDYLTIDPEDHYLLSAHLGPGILYVVDLRTNTLVKAISGVPGITGVEYISGKHKAYTSDWGEGKIGVVDLKTMAVVKRLPTESKPNGISYAQDFGKAYAVNTLAKAVSVIDVEKDEIVKILRFDSETGTPGYDSVAKRMYVSLRSTNEVAEIDPATDRIVGKYPVEGCVFDHGMAIDSEHHRAFLLCGRSQNLTVFALDSHKAIAHFPIPTGADVVKYDSGNGRVYAACSSGSISVVQEDDPDHFHKLGDVPVAKSVHSLAVDPATHRVYAPEQEEDGKPVARIIVYEASHK